MAEAKPQVGAVKLPIRVTVTQQDSGEVVDLSEAETVTLILRKPDGTRLEREMTLTNDGTDGQAYYRTQEDELDVGGLWKYQVVLEYADGSSLPSEVGTFRVYDNA